MHVALAVLAALGTGVGMHNALGLPQVKRIDIELPAMPADARPVTLAPLAELRALLGVYGVIGNHDYPSGYRDWLCFLRSCGIRMLVNEHDFLGETLIVAGVNDPMAAWNHEEGPNLPKALAGTTDGLPVVLLAHEPVFADTSAKDERVALRLSGHPHGGFFPGLAALIARYNGGYVNGLYHVGSMPFYVSPGTSLWSGMPIRLFCPAEITLITLRPCAH